MKTSKNKVEIFEINNLYGCRDSITMKTIIEPQYDSEPIFKNGIAIVDSEDKYGLIDHFGKILVPVKYDDIRGFQGEYTRVCFEDKWGIINIYGEEIISPKYDWIGEDNGISIAIFSEGITKLKENSIYTYDGPPKYGFANQDGDIIVKPRYSFAHSFKENLALIGRKNKYGYIGK